MASEKWKWPEKPWSLKRNVWFRIRILTSTYRHLTASRKNITVERCGSRASQRLILPTGKFFSSPSSYVFFFLNFDHNQMTTHKILANIFYQRKEGELIAVVIICIHYYVNEERVHIIQIQCNQSFNAKLLD